MINKSLFLVIYSKHLAFRISSVFIVLFFNCKEDLNTTFLDINISTENNRIVEVNIPEANGNALVIDTINSKIKETVIAALHIGNPDDVTSKSIAESITKFNTEYHTFKSDFPETEQQWEAQIDGELLYQSSEIISVSITSYVNTGGAHGNLNISFLNFESTTGKRLSNARLFTDSAAFKNIAKTYFEKAIKGKDILFDRENFELPMNITYTEDGLVLLYNTYEIAPYSTGIIEFAIPFEAIDSYLVFNSTY